MGSGKWQFWIDRGGTFTDIVARDPFGRISSSKILSENSAVYADAALHGVSQTLGLSGDMIDAPGKISAVKMGTTVATNALLERKGQATALVTTQGFRDLPLIGYQSRDALFDLCIEKKAPLFTHVLEAIERVDARGEIALPLDQVALTEGLKTAHQDGYRSVAIAFLHAHVNPHHEEIAAEIAQTIGFTQVSTSHATSRLSKIVSRTDTCVVDAYLSPILRRYVEKVSEGLDLGRSCDQLLFMQSNGGLVKADQFQGRDAILSGPAGGIVGMVRTAEAAGDKRLIGFDMGGTSTDVSHYAGQFERSFETEVAGVRLRAPMLDIHTVAAGGGSVLTFQDGRAQVGPESAGADPGPACYRQGGPLTVTDANVLLGRIQPRHFPTVFGPNGDEPIDRRVVREKFETLAQDIALATGRPAQNAEDTAEGFLRIAVDNMAAAIKKITIERGHDVSDYTLQCFGGAGGQHACRVADVLGVKRVFLHPFAGVLSALGMGLAEMRALAEEQFSGPLTDTPRAQSRLADLASDVTKRLKNQAVDTIAVQSRAHLKYAGAHQSLPVDFGSQENMKSAFEAAHEERFGFTMSERAILFDMLEVEGASPPGALPEIDLPPSAELSPMGQVDVYLEGQMTSVDAFDRASLGKGTQFEGPALVIEGTGTTIVEPGWRGEIDALGNLILTRVVGQVSTETAGIDADPVRLEVFNNLFMSIADQMGVTLANTSWSVNIKERLDFSCAIFDAAGDLVANAPHVPVHLGSMSAAIKAVIERTAGTAVPGDAYMLNSPFHGGTHLPDVTVVTPVFVEGRPAFWVGSRGHHADIGGRTPGSAPPDSKVITDEGVVIEFAQLARAGRFLEAEARAILASGPFPARQPDQNIADLKAQLAANETGRRELLRAVSAYGLTVVHAFMGHVQDNAEESVRQVIEGLSDGAFTYPLDDGSEIRVAVRVDKETRTATVDFTGTSKQHKNNYNAPLAISNAVVLYSFRTLVGKNIPLNQGCLKPIQIIVPEGTLLNPRPPAAVIAGNTEVSQAACNALMGALGAMAASQGTMNNFIWGNETFQNYETIAGGSGAGPGFAGADAVQSHMTNTRMTDPEILEERFPVRLEEFSIRRGSGGDGQWRGGDGAVRRLRFLEPVTVTTLSSSRIVPPFGMNGGGAGAVGANSVEMPDGTGVSLRGNDEINLPAGAVFVMKTPGGGGWGQA